MFHKCLLLIASAIIGFSVSALHGEDEWPRPVLQVVRLKPGENIDFEMAVPVGEFKLQGKSGRDWIIVNRLLKDKFEMVTFENVQPNDKGVFELGDGLSMAWGSDKPGVSLRTTKDAKPGTTDLRITYRQFTAGSGKNIMGVRVVIQAE